MPFSSDLAFVFGNQNALQGPVHSTFQVRAGHGKPLPRHFTVDNVLADSRDYSKHCLLLRLLLQLMVLGLGAFSLFPTPLLLFKLPKRFLSEQFGNYKDNAQHVWKRREEHCMLQPQPDLRGGAHSVRWESRGTLLMLQAGLNQGDRKYGELQHKSEPQERESRGAPVIQQSQKIEHNKRQ